MSVIMPYAKEDSVALMQGALSVYEDAMAKVHVRRLLGRIAMIKDKIKKG